MKSDNKKYQDIASGKIPDDYTNHFLSHFGFYSPYDDRSSPSNTKTQSIKNFND